MLTVSAAASGVMSLRQVQLFQGSVCLSCLVEQTCILDALPTMVQPDVVSLKGRT